MNAFLTTKQTLLFAGKVAFITNAGAGIGRAVALAFARQGARVAVVGSTPANNDETVCLVAQAGGQAVPITCDTTDEQQVQAALAQTLAVFGRLDFALNNAEVEQQNLPAADRPIGEWNRLVNNYLRGTFLGMKHEIPLILRQGGGAIVNTSAGAGLVGSKDNAAYYAAQHGIMGMTCAAAPSYVSLNLRINALCPSASGPPAVGCFTGGAGPAPEKVRQEVPSGRLDLPEEIAKVAVWLCAQGSPEVGSPALALAGSPVAIF